ncbi:transcription elongation factor GreA [Ichthyobacterium seriolicida]|uniref:Transcription elongation factor GreA n=1 Tax=Ichthyobacterium seriolicida TaxID=242600 RepID=A0A1J1E2V2_9FLAO|nr:transcription elongation factor GreA [Ichthyobacterium seriolicida]BAV94356.1 transcription elongation factor GreA [Ichthyobacterium seriolicida]
MSKVSYYTKKGLEELKKELHRLKSVERLKISNQISEARDKGDLSENAEYDASKEAQGLLELRISKLEQTLSEARLIDESQLDNSKVLILSKVKVKNTNTDAVMDYVLVTEGEADISLGKISISSPIGKSLLGKQVGDKVDITVPNGIITLEIIQIDR